MRRTWFTKTTSGRQLASAPAATGGGSGDVASQRQQLQCQLQMLNEALKVVSLAIAKTPMDGGGGGGGSAKRSPIENAALDARSMTLSLVRLMKELGDDDCTYDVFLSHYKAQGGTVAQMLKSIIGQADSKIRLFLDSDNLDNLEQLPLNVLRSRRFFLMMSPYDQAATSTLEMFGPFGRKYCLIEIITWFQQQSQAGEEIPATVITLQHETLKTAEFPRSRKDVESILDQSGWDDVNNYCGCRDAQKLAWDACETLSKLKPLEWNYSEKSVKSETQLRVILQASGIKSSAEDVSRLVAQQSSPISTLPMTRDESSSSPSDATVSIRPRNNRRLVSAVIISASDCRDEATLFINQTESEFPDQIEFVSGNEATYCIVLLSAGLLNDLPSLRLISTCTEAKCEMIPVEISKIGLARFDYGRNPDAECGIKVTNAFITLKRTLAKPLSPHGSTDQVSVQLKTIWGRMGLVSVSSKTFPGLPFVSNIYDFPISKALVFAPGTREWVFSQIYSWAEENLCDSNTQTSMTSNNVFVIVGTAGLGKSVIAAEFARRYSSALSARYRKAAASTSSSSSNNDNGVTLSVCAIHFFKYDDATLREASSCLGSVARQLANEIDGFRSNLENSLSGVSSLDDLKDLETLFRKAILEPAKAWSARKSSQQKAESQNFLIVMDALDECINRADLIPVLAKLWPNMPSQFGLVLTTRPDVQVPKLEKFEPHYLKSDDESNRRDIKAFIQSKLGPGIDPEVCTIVEENSNGMFLYAMFACDELLVKRPTNASILVRAKALPVGIYGIYIEYFSSLLLRDFNKDRKLYSSALAPILASRVPLPEEIWKAIVMEEYLKASPAQESSLSMIEQEDLQRQFQSKVKAPLERLLNFSAGAVSVLHKSMDDFLRSSDEAKEYDVNVNVAIGHELVSKYFLNDGEKRKQQRKPSWESPTDARELFQCSHALYHLIAAADYSLAIKTVLSIDSMMKMLWAAKRDSNFARLSQDIQSLYDCLVNPSLQLDDADLEAEHEKQQQIRFCLKLLLLAEKALMYDPRQFAGQVLGRISGITNSNKELVGNVRDWVQRAQSQGKLSLCLPTHPTWSGLQPAGGSLLKIFNHDSPLNSVAVSRDGTLLFIGCQDGKAYVRDAVSGKVIRVLEGHVKSVESIAVSDDNAFICTGCSDGSTRIWDGKTGRVLQDVAQWNKKAVYSVAISPDAKYLFTASVDKTACIWSVETGTLIRRLEGQHTNQLRGIAVSRNGAFFVTTSNDETARMWDVETGHMIHVLQGHTDIVTSVAITSDSKYVLTGSSDKTVLIFEVERKRVISKLEGHSGTIWSVAVSDDSKYVFTGSDDKTARAWDFNTGAVVSVLSGHSFEVRSIAVSSHSASQPLRIYTGSWDKTARVWEFQRDEQNSGGGPVVVAAAHTARVKTITVSKDAAYLQTTDYKGTKITWSVSTGLEATELGSGITFLDPTSLPLVPRDGLFVTPAAAGVTKTTNVPAAVGYTQDLLGDCYVYNRLVFGRRDKSFECWHVAS